MKFGIKNNVPLLKREIHSDLLTLKKAWEILKHLKIEGLLIGAAVNVDITELCIELIERDKLAELCSIITKSKVNDDVLLGDAMAVILSFFTSIGSQLAIVRNLISLTPQATPE